MSELHDSKNVWLTTEYTALTRYFVNVITFRFTTAAFFIAAVALVLRNERPNYVLLFALSFGIWVVELRNRAIFDNLLHRAWEIEEGWRDIEKGELPFFTHMTPHAAKEAGHNIAHPLGDDRTRVLWFRSFSAHGLSHTLGLDILYLSVMLYSVWSVSLGAWSRVAVTLKESSSMDPVVALFTFGVMFLGYRIISTTRTLSRWRAWVVGLVGVLLLVFAAAFAWCKGA